MAHYKSLRNCFKRDTSRVRRTYFAEKNAWGCTFYPFTGRSLSIKVRRTPLVRLIKQLLTDFYSALFYCMSQGYIYDEIPLKKDWFNLKD